MQQTPDMFLLDYRRTKIIPATRLIFRSNLGAKDCRLLQPVRLMAAALPNLAADWPTPLSPRGAAEATARSSLLAQQSARRSHSSNTSRALDLPDPDLAATGLVSTSPDRVSATGPPAIKFPEPNATSSLSSTLIGSTATAQIPMLASAPTLPCTPMSADTIAAAPVTPQSALSAPQTGVQANVVLCSQSDIDVLGVLM